jgi:hypothetical protein
MSLKTVFILNPTTQLIAKNENNFILNNISFSPFYEQKYFLEMPKSAQITRRQLTKLDSEKKKITFFTKTLATKIFGLNRLVNENVD